MTHEQAKERARDLIQGVRMDVSVLGLLSRSPKRDELVAFVDELINAPTPQPGR